MGHLLGDRGSGFWIGRIGLARAVEDFEHRRSTGLRRRAERRFGPLDGLLDELQREVQPVARIASFSRDVAALARTGDAASARIWMDAGSALGESASDAADHVFSSRLPVRVTITGGLAGGSPLLLPAVLAVLEERRAGSTVRSVRQGALRGAVRLARDPGYAAWFPGAVLEHRRP
jgi:N-acetylglucosamine kinase-like BadF-type ATPase